MKRVSMIGLLIVSLALMACKPTLEGSGVLVVKRLDLAGFEQIEASQAFRVEITRAEAFSVQVHIDDNLAEHLRVRIVKDRLEIGMNPDYNYRTGKQSMLAKVSLPRLSSLRLSGASQATLSGFDQGEPLALKLSGASRLTGRVTASEADVELSGASELSLTGSASKAVLELSGASDADLGGFALGRAEASLSGASHALVKVSGRLDAQASGASELSYLGSPELGHIETSGASSVRPQ